jgi:hypothetical protein
MAEAEGIYNTFVKPPESWSEQDNRVYMDLEEENG